MAEKNPRPGRTAGSGKSRPGGKSCYALELSVDPGGARRGDLYVYRSLEHIRQLLEQEFLAASDEAAYLALSYGERIVLWVVQGGTLADAVDLRPLIRVNGAGLEGASLDALATLERFRTWSDGGTPLEFTIDWEGIAARVPPLEGALLEPGQSIPRKGGPTLKRVRGSYLATTDRIAYGYTDLESGEEPPEDWEDPDPRSRLGNE